MEPSATAPLSVLVADDEAPARDELAFLLRDYPDIEIAALARNGLEAVQLIRETQPDVVFLDVQMPGLDGLAVIERLRGDGTPLPAFVLCTAFEQYALEAFRIEALDYLLKPVEKERLAVTMERVRRAFQPLAAPAQPQAFHAKIVIRSGGRNLIVDAQDLIFATITEGAIRAVAANAEGSVNYKTIEEMQQSLDPAHFWRVHRGYIVNIHRIREVIPWFKSSFQLRMDDKGQTEIPVSRAQTPRLRELLRL